MPKLQGLQLSLLPEFRSSIPITTMKINRIDAIALAKVQYCIYGNALEWKDSSGSDILQWEELPTKVKKHWIELAEYEIKENLQQLISRYENYPIKKSQN